MHVITGWGLMQPQMKLPDNGEYVVEYIGLDPFVIGPGGGRREAVDLQRQAVGGRCQLAHHQGHVLANAGVGAQVGIQVGAQGEAREAGALLGGADQAGGQATARGIGVDEDLADAPQLDEVFPKLLEFMGELPLLGHSILFDYSFPYNSLIIFFGILKNSH